VKVKWQRGLKVTNDSPFLLADTHSCPAVQTAGVGLWQKLSGFGLLLLLKKTCALIHLVLKGCDASRVSVTVQLHINSCAMTEIIST